MLERISRFYGKEAAANNKPRNADVDKEFMMWVAEMGKQLEDADDKEGFDFDFMEHLDHMIDCWENGYDAYKRGEVI